jgi:uncharacterized membrane protein SpoIIM required for sporulation
MREVVFLKQNADKWKQFESLFDAPEGVDPDRLAELFVELTDDLAYAQTFYPDSKTTAYLNALTARVYETIYRNKKEDRSRFVRFWKTELPMLFYQVRRELLVSFSIFTLACLIGMLSVANDDTFVRLILGDAYVNMTLANIQKGDPMAVYKQAHQVDMFLGITFNNIRVSLLAFAAGLLLSFGTGFILFSNGIMLGSFQYFFYEQGLLWDSARTIWIHGTLEISAIVIAGCAGLVMGNSILFPGTYARRTSFRNGARNGLKIVIGLVPIFITAGFLESFVTRLTRMPDWLSILIIVLSLGFIIWYVVIYPMQLHTRTSISNTSSDA